MDKQLKSAQRTTMFIAMVASFVIPFAGSSLNIAIPFIGKDFQVPATSLSWIMSAMMLTTIALSVPFGRFADLWGKRRLFNIGIFVFFIATLFGYFAPAFPFLIVMRVVQGAGGAMLISTNMAILMDVFPAQQRGRVLGLAVMCTYIGLSLGPVLGGLITHNFGWRMIFTVTAAVTFVTFVVALVSSARLSKMPTLAGAGAGERGALGGEGAVAPAGAGAPTGSVAGDTADGRGAVAPAGPGAPSAAGDAARVVAGRTGISPLSILLYMVAMVTFMYGFTIFAQNVWSYILVGAGVVLFVVFARHESKAASPVIEVRLFKGNPNFIFSNLTALLNYAATFAISYILAIYLEVIKGYPADVAGLILISYPVIMAIVSPIAGRLSDRFSPYKLSTIGMVICVCAMLSFLLVDKDSPLIHIIIALMVGGFGFGLFSSPNTNAVMSCVTPRDFGVANSILSTMRSVGQASSMAIITIVMHFTLGDALITDPASAPNVMQAFNTTFIVFAALCAAGILLSLRRREPPKGTEPKG